MKMNKSKSNIFAAAFCLLIGSANISASQAQYTEVGLGTKANSGDMQEVNKDAHPQTFLELFEDGKYQISGSVNQYINRCCGERDAVIELLRDNGFKVETKTYSKDEPVNRGYGSEFFDEVIFGSRGPSWKRFWDIFSAYKVTLYIREGKVAQINAHVDRTMP